MSLLSFPFFFILPFFCPCYHPFFTEELWLANFSGNLKFLAWTERVLGDKPNLRQRTQKFSLKMHKIEFTKNISSKLWLLWKQKNSLTIECSTKLFPLRKVRTLFLGLIRSYNYFTLLFKSSFTVPFVTATTSCSSSLLVRDVSNPSGIIQSNMGSSYGNNMDCSWNLSSNAVLELVFVSFNTELSTDYVYVYDGDSPSSPLIGQFSGGSLPATITSSSKKLYIRFTSDGSGQYAGFRALYRGMLLL